MFYSHPPMSTTSSSDTDSESKGESARLLTKEAKRSVVMTQTKVTKNTVVYAAKTGEDGPPPVKTVYVEKWFLGDPPPPSIRLTLDKRG